MTAHAGAMKTLTPAAVMMAAGTLLMFAAFLVQDLAFAGASQLPLYCLGLLFMGALAWWEATRRPGGALPVWTSPPVLIAGWSLAWIYLPALVAFLDDSVVDELTRRNGGEAVLLAGLPLACGALAMLSLSYHVTMLTLGRRVPMAEYAERYVPLPRVLALYGIGTLARALRFDTLGMAFGAELTSWGVLQPLDQWIGYVEDLRLLALALLVAHVVRRGSGRAWLGVALTVELMFGLSSGFFTPVIMPVVLCAVTATAFDRLRSRNVALVAAAAVAVSTFVPVIAAIREDRLGGVGTADLSGVGDAVSAPARYWLDGVSGGEGVYAKFFGRQIEVASATGLVVTLSPEVVPYEGFERFLTLPAGLIPRVFWPDKPTLSRGVWFSSAFRGLDQDTTSYSAMTIFTEGYLFYGWIGAVVAMLIAGAVLAVLRRGLDNPRFLLVYLALVPTILQIEPEFSSYLTVLVQRSLVFVVAFLLLSHGKAVNPPARRIAGKVA